jgi:carotenoid cleavage dioxygenase
MSTFGGCMTSKTMTAHPKADPVTGELIFYGSAAKGETTPDIAVYTADAAGTITGETWIVPPYASMVHDFAVTQNWIIFPIMPTVSSLERLRNGQVIYNWEPERGMYVGVLPRRGTAEDIRWFRGESCWVYHIMNAFEEGDEIHVDLCDGPIQPFPFFHVDPSRTWDPESAVTRLTRWTIRPHGNTDAFQKRVLGPWWVDLPKIDERRALGHYTHGFTATNDFEKPLWNAPGESGFVYNSIAHWNHETVTRGSTTWATIARRRSRSSSRARRTRRRATDGCSQSGSATRTVPPSCSCSTRATCRRVPWRPSGCRSACGTRSTAAGSVASADSGHRRQGGCIL